MMPFAYDGAGGVWLCFLFRDESSLARLMNAYPIEDLQDGCLDNPHCCGSIPSPSAWGQQMQIKPDGAT
jgi:hypothetical protein